LADGWVCYHIGVGYPSPIQEWIGAGYYTQEGLGTVFYIEWYIDGVYNEITASGVTFGEQYWIQILNDIGSGGVNGDGDEGHWGATIWDSKYGNILLKKYDVDLPLNGDIHAVAEGESVDSRNDMEADFSELRWEARARSTRMK